VAGEGPYRVEETMHGNWGVRPGPHGTKYHAVRPDKGEAIAVAGLMNCAHRTALAVREAEVVRLRKALGYIAENIDRAEIMAGVARDALKGDAR
jgi:hypothetical protein